MAVLSWVTAPQGPSTLKELPRTNSRIAPLNLVGTRSTASPTSGIYGNAVEHVPTIAKRFLGRGMALT
jgi:hypothetical protein